MARTLGLDDGILAGGVLLMVVRGGILGWCGFGVGLEVVGLSPTVKKGVRLPPLGLGDINAPMPIIPTVYAGINAISVATAKGVNIVDKALLPLLSTI